MKRLLGFICISLLFQINTWKYTGYELESWTPGLELAEFSDFNERELYYLGPFSSPDVSLQYLSIFPGVIQSAPEGKLFQMKPPSAFGAFKTLVSFRFLPIILTRGYS